MAAHAEMDLLDKGYSEGAHSFDFVNREEVSPLLTVSISGESVSDMRRLLMLLSAGYWELSGTPEFVPLPGGEFGVNVCVVSLGKKVRLFRRYRASEVEAALDVSDMCDDVAQMLALVVGSKDA